MAAYESMPPTRGSLLPPDKTYTSNGFSTNDGQDNQSSAGENAKPAMNKDMGSGTHNTFSQSPQKPDAKDSPVKLPASAGTGEANYKKNEIAKSPDAGQTDTWHSTFIWGGSIIVALIIAAIVGKTIFKRKKPSTQPKPAIGANDRNLLDLTKSIATIYKNT